MTIMVVIDTLTKAAHFFLVKSTFGTTQVASVFMKEIFKLHLIQKMIISNRDAKFTSTFLKTLFWRNEYKAKLQYKFPSSNRWKD